MTVKLGYKTAWLILFSVVALAGVIVVVPVWLIQPFAPQTSRGLEISYYLRSLSPSLTIIFTLATIALAIFIWKRSRWYSRIPLVIPLFVIFFFTWFARQNHFEWMFNPLADAKFATVAET